VGGGQGGGGGEGEKKGRGKSFKNPRVGSGNGTWCHVLQVGTNPLKALLRREDKVMLVVVRGKGRGSPSVVK